jgi:hypothetical protein
MTRKKTNRNQPSRKLTKQSIEDGKKIAEAYRTAVASLASTPDATPQSIYAALAAMQHDLIAMQASSLYETQLISWLDSFGTAYHQMPQWFRDHIATSTFAGFQQPPEPPIVTTLFPEDEGPRFSIIFEAAENYRNRKILTRDQFDLLSHQARASAFTIGGGMAEEAIEKVRDIIQEAIADGPSLDRVRQAVEEKVPESVMTPAKVELVYRQAIQSSYRDGRESLISNPVVADVFPYQAYIPIEDGRVRPEHLKLGKLGLSGTNIYRREDPIWDYFTPPWDYNCRCGVNLLTVNQAARLGVKEAQEWLRTGNKPPLVSRLEAINFRPKMGFGQRSGLLSV